MPCGGAANRQLSLLDKVQQRTTRLIAGDLSEAVVYLDSLQHQRDVAGMCVMYKVQQQGVEHLLPL